ncbi:MAG: ATP synthase F1 subunit epsilon [Bdellovibrio sp.]|jgi:F-type H+-transporting ATPase subunit epsilon
MFKLNLVTPEKRLVVDQELEEITLPAHSGELNILLGHAPLMTTLEPGVLTYRLKNGQADKLAISWGYCQVSAEGVSVLAEKAVRANEVDLKDDQEQLKNNETRMMTETLDDVQWEKLQKDVARLHAEIELAQGRR